MVQTRAQKRLVDNDNAVPTESNAIPVRKRARGNKKVKTEPELLKEPKVKLEDFVNDIGDRKARDDQFKKIAQLKETSSGANIYDPTDMADMFGVALGLPDWRRSRFHQQIINQYLVPAITFKNQAIPPKFWLRKLEKVGIAVEITTVEKRRGICDLCNEPRYLSKKMKLDNMTFILGPNCCEKLEKIHTFYKETNALKLEFKTAMNKSYSRVLDLLK